MDADWGEGGRGQIQASQSHLSPNSDFSSDFAHFILEILKNLKISVYIQNFSLKIVISGGTFPRNSEPGAGTRTHQRRKGRQGGWRVPPAVQNSGDVHHKSRFLKFLSECLPKLFDFFNNFRIKLAKSEEKSDYGGRWFDSSKSGPWSESAPPPLQSKLRGDVPAVKWNKVWKCHLSTNKVKQIFILHTSQS